MKKGWLEALVESEEVREQVKKEKEAKARAQASTGRQGSVFIPREFLTLKLPDLQKTLYLILLLKANHAPATTEQGDNVGRGQCVASAGSLMNIDLLRGYNDNQIRRALTDLQKRGYIDKNQPRKKPGCGSIITIREYDAITAVDGVALPDGWMEGELTGYNKEKEQPAKNEAEEPVIVEPITDEEAAFIEDLFRSETDMLQFWEDLPDSVEDGDYKEELLVNPETGEILEPVCKKYEQ